MAYQIKLIDFETPEERTEKFDQWLQGESQTNDVSLKDAVLGTDQAMIIYQSTPHTTIVDANQ